MKNGNPARCRTETIAETIAASRVSRAAFGRPFSLGWRTSPGCHRPQVSWSIAAAPPFQRHSASPPTLAAPRSSLYNYKLAGFGRSPDFPAGGTFWPLQYPARRAPAGVERRCRRAEIAGRGSSITLAGKAGRVTRGGAAAGVGMVSRRRVGDAGAKGSSTARPTRRGSSSRDGSDRGEGLDEAGAARP